MQKFINTQEQSITAISTDECKPANVNPIYNRCIFSTNNKWINKPVTYHKDSSDAYWALAKQNNLTDKIEQYVANSPVNHYPQLTTLDGQIYSIQNTASQWINLETNVEGLFDIVTNGFPVCSQLKNYDGNLVGIYKGTGWRNSRNFYKSTVACIDIDDHDIVTTQYSPFYEAFSAGYYASPSYTESVQKHRQIYILERAIDTPDDMRYLYIALGDKLGGDPKCKDAARLYYGNQTDLYEMRDGKFIPNPVIDELLKYGKHLDEESKKPSNNKTIVRDRKTQLNSDEYELTLGTYLDLNNGESIRFGDITGKVSGLLCPFHYDANGSEFASVNSDGTPYFVCGKCNGGKAIWAKEVVKNNIVKIDSKKKDAVVQDDNDKETYHEHSDGNLEVVRAKVLEAYKRFAESNDRAIITITNPGIGKTLSIPKAVDKLVYARSNNMAVRKLGEELQGLYPDKTIETVFSFTELFKERFPDHPIQKLATDDVFTADYASWSKTFETLYKSDRLVAKEMLFVYQSQREAQNLFKGDIVCMTTTMLRTLLWQKGRLYRSEPTLKTDKKTGELVEDWDWKHPVRRLDKILKGKGNKITEKWKKWKLARFLRDWDEYEEAYQEYNAIPEDYVIVVDDITSMDTGNYKPLVDGDVVRMGRKKNRTTQKNRRYDQQIKKLREKMKKESDPLKKQFMERKIQYIAAKRRVFKIKRFEYDEQVYLEKPGYTKVVNPEYRYIFTAAELFQLQDIQCLLEVDNIKHTVTNLRETQPVTNLRVIPSMMTRSNCDGLLYPIFNWARKQSKVDAEYVANGYGCEFNHTNIKGLNELNNTNIVFKSSQLHPA